MDLSEALGLDQGLPEQGEEAHREIHERLSSGETVREVLEDRGHGEETIQRAERVYEQILNAEDRELEAIRANLVMNVAHLSWLERWLKSDDPAADWGIAMLPVDFSEREREAAVRRILGRLEGPPIHPERWRANRDALVAACEDLDVRIEQLAAARAWEAVYEAVRDMTPMETRDNADEAMRSFGRHLRRLVCDDLLPGWDWSESRSRTEPIEEAPTQALTDAAFDAARASAEIDALLEKADLSEYQEAILALDAKGYSNPEIAEELGRSTSAISSAKSDARRKIRDISSLD